jgi:regulator of extracellular matrix RemA (YlzA/DUF370 family)
LTIADLQLLNKSAMINFTWGRRTLLLIIITLFSSCKSAMINFTWGRRTLLLIIITLFRSCKSAMVNFTIIIKVKFSSLR